MSDSSETKQRRIPHIAILVSSGMGHVTPSLRLAASLATTQNCRLTLITTRPTVSLAETHLISCFLSAFPHITKRELHLLPLDPPSANNNNNNDPFFLQYETIIRSAHLLSPLLTDSSPPLSALVVDIAVAYAVIPITTHLGLPIYVLFVSCATMLSLCVHFPTVTTTTTTTTIPDNYIHIPSLPPIPKTWLPPPLLDPTTLFFTQFIANGRKITESNGIIINTLDALESDALDALNQGKVVKGFPPVIPVGPLVPCAQFERSVGQQYSTAMAWLDEQREGSVVYVSFGSKIAMSREQIREVGEGLVRSGWRFMWVVKGKVVDKEENEEVEELVGSELMEKLRETKVGVVVKEWVDQGTVLGHRAVGGFLSHSGWNSVMEAAWHGVRVLAWPQGGDHRVNAEVVVRSGLGVWEERWGWCGGRVELVRGEEIGRKIKEMMEDEEMKVRVGKVREEARRAKSSGGGGGSALDMLVAEMCGTRSPK